MTFRVVAICFASAASGQDLFLGQPQLPCATPDCEEFEFGGEPWIWQGQADGCKWPRDQNVCPQKIGGGCPHNYNNTMDDYEPSTNESLHLEADVRTFLQNKMDEYLAIVDDCAAPYSSMSANVFGGEGGRALMHLRLHTLGFTPKSGGYSSHLARAREYIDAAENKLWMIPTKYCGFSWGKVGVHTLGAIIHDMQGDDDGAAKFVEHVRDSFKAAPSDNSCPYDDWDSGRAGLLYAAALLDQHFGKTMIDRSLVLAVANATVARGAALSAKAGVNYMEFISPNDGKSWVGMSHGSAGVLYGLLSYAPEILDTPPAKELIVRTLDHIVSTQLPSGNFPTEFYVPTDDVLVQWDHGAPGVSAALLVAAAKIPEGAERWNVATTKALETVWERGLLTKGLMLCHGLGGNIYMQLFAAKQNKSKKYLHRALQFVRYFTQNKEYSDVALMRMPTPSPLLFWITSWESFLMWGSDLIAHAEDPTKAMMPMFEVTF